MGARSDDLVRAVAIFREHDRVYEHIDAVGMLAVDAAVTGQMDLYDEVIAEGTEHLARVDSEWYRLSAEAVVAIGRAGRGELREAGVEMRRVRDALAEFGDVAFASRMAMWAALATRLLGDVETARADLRHSLALAAQAGVSGVESKVLFMLAELGDDTDGDGSARLADSLQRCLARGDRTVAARCTRDLADLARRRGDLDEAASLFRAAVAPLADLAPTDLGVLLVQLVPLADAHEVGALLDGAEELLAHSPPQERFEAMRLRELLADHGRAASAPEGAPFIADVEPLDVEKLVALACGVLERL
jgi:hypothetical protein